MYEKESSVFTKTGTKGFNRSFFILFVSFVFHAAVISAFLVLPLINCSIKYPPVKVKQTALKKPPPPPDVPKVKKAKEKKQKKRLVAPMGIPEPSEEAIVVEGIAGGVAGGVPEGVWGSTNYCLKGTLPPGFNTEEYQRIYENRFVKSLDNPLSTFSIDVDTGSYSNIRRFINSHRLPPKDAVRIEEMINYFRYDYPEPTGKHPFSITTELTDCPWNSSHGLLHIGILGKGIEPGKTPPSSLVFLLDVSGSMDYPDKLPLLKDSFKLLVERLDDSDRVAIVVYAGAAGLVLPSTPGNHKEEILAALGRLSAGGCTVGGAGIQLAYKVAEENFIKKGNNRIILATDGDFNIGISSTAQLIRMIEEKREKGIFLTTLGFGTGNYKDSRLEQLADKGNGSYHYIDNILEGKKVFVHDMRGTLFTIARDVKIQVEFNPAKVDSYRLIGYENRKLQKEDFADDKKDAGELGAGHTVTALYEIIPAGSENKIPGPEPLRFQETGIKPGAHKTSEMALVKLRYKKPRGTTSRLITRPVKRKKEESGKGSVNSRFSAAVVMFGMLLRNSEYAGDSTYEAALALARGAIGKDHYGYRSEFIRLLAIAREIDKSN